MVRHLVCGAAILTMMLVRAPTVGEPDRRERKAASIIRIVQTAQQAHFWATGYYETLQCLASAMCVPPPQRGPLVSPDIVLLKDRYDYQLLFYRGPRAAVPGRSPSATPLTDFAMVAVPRQPAEGGPPALCGDRTGVIYVTPGDRMPRVRDGRCLDTSNRLQ